MLCTDANVTVNCSAVFVGPTATPPQQTAERLLGNFRQRAAQWTSTANGRCCSACTCGLPVIAEGPSCACPRRNLIFKPYLSRHSNKVSANPRHLMVYPLSQGSRARARLRSGKRVAERFASRLAMRRVLQCWGVW
jgi:hypothetical protein